MAGNRKRLGLALWLMPATIPALHTGRMPGGPIGEFFMSRFGVRVEKQYFEFSIAHFLLFADGTREPLHGHNYRCIVEAEGTLSADDMVLNYITFKPVVKKVCAELDHRTVLPLKNPDLRVWREAPQVCAQYRDGSRFSFPEQDCVLLDVHNTSTEILAVHVTNRLVEELAKTPDLARLSKLRVGIEEAPGQMSWFERDLSKG